MTDKYMKLPVCQEYVLELTQFYIVNITWIKEGRFDCSAAQLK